MRSSRCRNTARVDSISALMDAAWGLRSSHRLPTQPTRDHPGAARKAIAAWFNGVRIVSPWELRPRPQAVRHRHSRATRISPSALPGRRARPRPGGARRGLAACRYARRPSPSRWTGTIGQPAAPKATASWWTWGTAGRRWNGFAARRTWPQIEDLARFVQGEFYLYFGQVFDQPLDSPGRRSTMCSTLDPGFAAASRQQQSRSRHYFRDDENARRLIREYRRIDSTSVVAEVVGLADTLLFQSMAAKKAVLGSLDRRSFTVLDVPGLFRRRSSAARRIGKVPERRVLTALARRRRHRPGTDARTAFSAWRRTCARMVWTVPVRGSRRHPLQPRASATNGPVLCPGGWPSVPRSEMRPHRARDSSRWPRRQRHERHPRPGSSHSPRLGPRYAPRAPAPLVDSAPLPTSLALDLEARAALRHADTADRADPLESGDDPLCRARRAVGARGLAVAPASRSGARGARPPRHHAGGAHLPPLWRRTLGSWTQAVATGNGALLRFAAASDPLPQ